MMIFSWPKKVPPRERAEQQVLGDSSDPESVGAASSSARAATFPGSSLCFLTPGVPFMSGQFTLEPGDEERLARSKRVSAAQCERVTLSSPRKTHTVFFSGTPVPAGHRGPLEARK